MVGNGGVVFFRFFSLSLTWVNQAQVRKGRVRHGEAYELNQTGGSSESERWGHGGNKQHGHVAVHPGVHPCVHPEQVSKCAQ